MIEPLALPYACGEPLLSGVIRSEPGDFFVEEQLGFEPEGEGEHSFLWVEKTGLNTEQVARRLAGHAGVAVRQVSYAGLKDRRARTRQWFSVHLPGKKTCNWGAVECEQLRILNCSRHRKKLRRGVHRGNRFVIRVREVAGDAGSLSGRAGQISHGGVPNYFGEQRFGRHGDNVQQAMHWFAGTINPRRHQQGIYLSAARAYLFNAVLAERVRQGNWQTALPGELLMLAGSHSQFPADDVITEDIVKRVDSGDIDPTGPLYGKPGKLTPRAVAMDLEARIMRQHSTLCEGLSTRRIDADRRSLRLLPKNFSHQWIDTTPGAGVLTVSFDLPGGCFATTVMRELIHYHVAPLVE